MDEGPLLHSFTVCNSAKGTCVLYAGREWKGGPQAVERQVKALIKNLSIFFLFPSKEFLPRNIIQNSVLEF